MRTKTNKRSVASQKMITNQMVHNLVTSRTEWIYKWLDTQGRNIEHECGHPIDITIDDYKRSYERGDIAARIVEVFPQESWQENPDVYESEENEETAFEKAWDQVQRDHNIFSTLQRVDTLSGIGRFGIILIGLNDGKGLNQPVQGINEKGEFEGADNPERKILYLRTFDESTVTVKEIEKDQTNPRFGQPKSYSIKFQDTSLMQKDGSEVLFTTDSEVHWSRVLHVCDNRTDSEVYGQPRLKRIYNRLLDLKKTLGGSGEMFWRGGFPGLSIETQPLNSDETVDFDKEATKAEIELYQKGLKRYLALIGMTAKSLAPQIADPTHHMNVQVRMISIAMSIPWRILMGAELGQLASEQDITAWNKRVARRQKDYVAPYIIVPFVKRLQGMGILPKIEEGGFIHVEWADTHTVTETDKATVAEKRTNAITKYVQGGGDMVISPFHFLTLVLNYTHDEANSIMEQVEGMLEEDRALKEEMANASLESEKAAATQKNNGGAGNGNPNGSVLTSRNGNRNTSRGASRR